MMTPTSKKKNKPNKKPLINLRNKNTEANRKALKAKKKQRTAAEMGSRPVQERDTGPGGMTATGPKRKLGKAVTSNQKKYGTRVGTGSVSARNAKKKLRK